MAIYTERTVKVSNNKSTMDKDIYIYRGNRNIEIHFTLIDPQFKFKDANMVDRLSPSHAYVTLLNPQKVQIGTGKTEVVDGVIKTIISSAMIDKKTECGDYVIVIDLYDEDGDALLTIPPIEKQLHVLERMTDIDDVPDELRFVFDEQTENLDVVNIDVTYSGDGEIKTIEGIPLHDTTARKIMSELIEDVDNFNATVNEAVDTISDIRVDVDGKLSQVDDALVDIQEAIANVNIQELRDKDNALDAKDAELEAAIANLQQQLGNNITTLASDINDIRGVL